MSEPLNAPAIREYCAQHAAGIFVREKIGGLWQNVRLADLPQDRYTYWIEAFAERGRLPHRVLTEQEQRALKLGDVAEGEDVDVR